MPAEDSKFNVTRFWATVKHLSPRQVLIRGRRKIKWSLGKIFKQSAPHPPDVRMVEYVPLLTGLSSIQDVKGLSRDVAHIRARAAAVRNFEFSFLNQNVRFGHNIRWHDRNLSQLWRYHLHYFDFCEDLLVDYQLSGNSDNYTSFKHIATSWIEANKYVYGDGWHPYTLSVRVVNWLNALSGFRRLFKNDAGFKRLIASSLAGQLRVLHRDLEFDVRGNHLIKNLRALVCGSSAFSGKEAQACYSLAIRVLRNELKEQVLIDGGHFERNPGYHLSVLKDLLECAIWIEKNRGTRYPWLDSRLQRMLVWLETVAMPDNRLPLIKDTTRDNRDTITDVLSAGAMYFNSADYKLLQTFGLYPALLFGKAGYERQRSWKTKKKSSGSIALQTSGFYLMRDADQKDFLIFDAGKTCPDYLPAHAHADMLSYELTIAGQPVIVDSGVYEYKPGKWRDFFRSTRAHNTVEVGHSNQSDVWSSFRVGKRAFPGPVKWQDTDAYTWVAAEHDGYRSPIKAIHKRAIKWQKGRFWVFMDNISGNANVVANSYIHLHPDIRLTSTKQNTWLLEGGPVPIWLTAFGHTSHTVTSGQRKPFYQGWYSECFGEKVPNTVLSINKAPQSLDDFGYVIAKEESAEVSLKTGDSTTPFVSVLHQKREFRYHPDLSDYQ